MSNVPQVLDLGSKVANLAGLTARVSQMLEALTDTAHNSNARDQHQHHSSSGSGGSRGRQHKTRGSRQALFSAAGIGDSMAGVQPDRYDTEQHCSQNRQQQQQPLQEVAAGKSPSHQRYASQAVLLQAPQLVLVPVPGASAAATAAAAAAGDDLDLLDAAAARTGGSLLAAREPTVAAARSSTQEDESFSVSHKQQQSGWPDHHQQQQQQQQLVKASLAPAEVMQVSIHSMGADMLLQEVRRAFPDSPRLAPLLAVVTFQFCGTARTHMLHKLQQQQQQQHGVRLPEAAVQYSSSNSGNTGSAGVQDSCCPSCASGAGGCEGVGIGASSSSSSSSVRQGLCADADMQHMLGVFMAWQQAVYDHVTNW